MSKHHTPMTRRSFLVSGAVAIASSRIPGAQTPACTLIPEQEEGPYYVNYGQLRQDITEGRPGVPLQLRVTLVDSRRCAPIENAALDIWHCDALGVYSGFTSNGGGERGGPGAGGPPPNGGARGRGGPGRPGGGGPRGGRGSRGGDPQGTDSTRFLRGIQLTDKQGVVAFDTIYPGWYAGRTIQIHVKVHIGGAAAADRFAGGHVSHTGQFFLPEDITESIAKMDPYVQHTQVHRTLHSEDNIFRSQGGSRSMLNLTRLKNGTNAEGFSAALTVAVDSEATPAVF